MGNRRNRKRLVGSEVKWEKGVNIRFAARNEDKIAEIRSLFIFSTKLRATVFGRLVKIIVDLFRDRVLDSGPRMLLKKSKKKSLQRK